MRGRALAVGTANSGDESNSTMNQKLSMSHAF